MIETLNLINPENSIIVTIVNYGVASKILKTAKKIGATGGTILIGKGIIQSRVMKFLGIDETKKEIILNAVNKRIEKDFCKTISEKFEFKKKNKGIMFSLDINEMRGIKKDMNTETQNKNNETNNAKSNYEAVFVIVNRGNAKEVVEVATQNGANGGTILHGRGAGIYENSSLFSMAIEPEKEIILFLVQKEKISNMIKIIEKTMEIEKPGKGIIFTLPVNQTIGLYE